MPLGEGAWKGPSPPPVLEPGGGGTPTGVDPTPLLSVATRIQELPSRKSPEGPALFFILALRAMAATLLAMPMSALPP